MKNPKSLTRARDIKLTIISVPYDSAVRGFRMGAGPEHLLSAGLPSRLSDLGHPVDI